MLLLTIFTAVPPISETPPPWPVVMLIVVVVGAFATVIGSFWALLVISANETLYTRLVYAIDKPPPSEAFSFDQDENNREHAHADTNYMSITTVLIS